MNCFQLLDLSETFCSTLLKDDPNDHYSHDFDSLEGVPSYPLYNRLASALLKCTSSGAFCRICNHLTMIRDCSHIQQKGNEWQKLIVENGSEIALFADGRETIEVRIKSGYLILIKCVVFEVQGVQWHPVFSGMSETERLGKVFQELKIWKKV
ncbi:hypothetical protein QN277_003129 [Acacia crassicarpa]|uniref:Uncharacterized protein n=1 Tax=Acacia crassicarpa TaxID=499986 RepID=A0AAE1NCH5_9FABA|nr:hypothetical protein QN277_003129 [Acacia crassicarpa]